MASEEPHIVGSLAALCRDMGIGCVVQVGAEDGYEAWRIKQESERCGSACRAVAIDADPQCGPYKDVEWYEALIGREDAAEVPFFLYAKGLSSLVTRGENDHNVMMLMQRLDTFCWNNGIVPDALIIDTEGTTMDVLEGSTGILDGVRLIYAECSDGQIRPGSNSDYKDVAGFLLPRGFLKRHGLPAYDAGGQRNETWVRA